MKTTSRVLGTAALCGALLTATAPAYAADGPDVLDLVNVKRVPVSVLSQATTAADNILVSGIAGDRADEGRRDAKGKGVAGEAKRPYEASVVESLLGLLSGPDYEK
ncbi:hypothetical protein ACSNOK_20725 [Streptomyces sp. URMC 126]|uniref:hypothetical protein n=1 Tax=Streptomyces sp. URMC 126 TaxID=3423401 RepID=UPI003F194ED3